MINLFYSDKIESVVEIPIKERFTYSLTYLDLHITFPLHIHAKASFAHYSQTAKMASYCTSVQNNGHVSSRTSAQNNPRAIILRTIQQIDPIVAKSILKMVQVKFQVYTRSFIIRF